MKSNPMTRFSFVRPRRYMRGAAAVEFAIVLIPLLILVFGVAEYGRAMYQYNTIAKATRDSARMLSQYTPSDTSYPVQKAKCLAVYGNGSCSGEPLVRGLGTGMIEICDRLNSCSGGSYSDVTTGHGVINLVEVRVAGFTFESLMLPFLPNGTLRFNNIGTTMRQI